MMSTLLPISVSSSITAGADRAVRTDVHATAELDGGLAQDGPELDADVRARSGLSMQSVEGTAQIIAGMPGAKLTAGRPIWKA